MGETILEDRHYHAATLLGDAERNGAPVPASVRFDAVSGCIVVDFTNGATFMVPATSIQGLENASDAQLADVALLGETGLHWESLDVDFTIAGLMNGLFGTAKFMEAQRRGGQSRSEAKIKASRANGAKGGRPRKTR
jgi:hypothetical protein